MRKKFIILGCSSFMAGYTRMTYSLGVIMMETTQDLSLFVPILLSIITSNQIGYIFTRSLYQRATRGKQLPIITDKIPPPCKNLKAGDVMNDNPVFLNILDSVENIRDVLTANNHHAFPLINSEFKLVGIIPRNFIIIILKNEAWYGDE